MKLALDKAIEFKNKVSASSFQYVLLIGDAPHHGYADEATDDTLKNVYYQSSGRKGCCVNDPLKLAYHCGQLNMPICTVNIGDGQDTMQFFKQIAALSQGVYSSPQQSGGIAGVIFDSLLQPIRFREMYFKGWF